MSALTRPIPPNPSRPLRCLAAFTLPDLLSVLAITLLLLMLLLPALGRVRGRTVELRCASNLRQIGMAAQVYAQGDGRKRFPDCTGANWPWDIPAPVARELMNSGAKRDNFYCPGFPEQNNDELWTFTSNPAETTGFRVLGYSVAFKGAGRVGPTNVTESLNPAPYRVGAIDYNPPPSERVLSADATLSVGFNEKDRSRNRYTAIYGGWGRPHRSPHLRGRMPAGGNLVFLDGHTEWRRFERMRVRTVNDPAFWW